MYHIFSLINIAISQFIYTKRKLCIGRSVQIVFLLFPEKDTSVLNLIVSATSEGGQILLNLMEIRLTPTIHIDQLKITLIHSSFISIFLVLFKFPFIL